MSPMFAISIMKLSESFYPKVKGSQAGPSISVRSLIKIHIKLTVINLVRVSQAKCLLLAPLVKSVSAQCLRHVKVRDEEKA